MIARRVKLGPTPEWILRRERDRMIILIIGILATGTGVLLILGIAVTL